MSQPASGQQRKVLTSSVVLWCVFVHTMLLVHTMDEHESPDFHTGVDKRVDLPQHFKSTGFELRFHSQIDWQGL